MPSLWFCVPAHGRVALSAICLRQLRRTCNALADEGIEATAVVVADDENLDTARDLCFATVERDNRFVSRKFNDGIQLACDPEYNPRPADFVVLCGSDDFVDHRILLELPQVDTMLGFQHISFVREDGREMTSRFLHNEGGCGIRVYSRKLMGVVGYRPADEDRQRACDTSILVNLRRAFPELRVAIRNIDPRQIVDWKSWGANLNHYESIARKYRSTMTVDPYEELVDFYPAEALQEMAAHYGVRELVPA